MKVKSQLSSIALLLGLALTTNVSATAVTTGEFVLDFDEAGLLSLSNEVKNVGWFDSAASANKTPQEMRDTPPSDNIPDSFTFKVFGATIPTPPVGLAERAPQISTFEYEGNPTTGTGTIGLSGLHVIDSKIGGMSLGDYGLHYDASRIGNAANGSGWYIMNYHAFQLQSFDLTNVEVTVIDDNNFSLAGDVALASDLSFMLGAPVGTDVGDFTFTTVASESPDPFLDGSIANYSFSSEELTLPGIQVGNQTYAASFRAIILDNGQYTFELKNVELTTTPPGIRAVLNTDTGLLTIPQVVLVGGNGENNTLYVEMQLMPGHFPSAFILTVADEITE